MNFSATFTLGLLLLNVCITHAAVTATGNVTPSDAGIWTSLPVVHVGNISSGTLMINEGDVLFTEDGYLGFSSNATGTTTVSGTNSTWNSNHLYVGNDGWGELNLTSGGKASSDQSILGFEINSTGTINVTGSDSTWENGADLIVGRFGNGQLNISDGGTVDNHNCQLGFDTTSTGTVNVFGHNSTWTNRGELRVGNHGQGELNITEGGLVSVAGTLTIDADSGGDSFVSIASGGMLALLGDVDDSLTMFLNPIQGTGAIRYWDNSLDNWAPLTAATPDTIYTLEYLTADELNGYTLLTILNEDQGTPHNDPLPGDANGDGVVDGSDVTILASNWQTLTGATRSMGDFNGDGAVDGSDLTILAGNWQASTQTTTVTAVPEPGTLLMLLFCLLALGFVRRIQ